MPAIALAFVRVCLRRGGRCVRHARCAGDRCEHHARCEVAVCAMHTALLMQRATLRVLCIPRVPRVKVQY